MKRLLSVLLVTFMLLTAASTVAIAKDKVYKVRNSEYTQLTVSGGSGKISWSSSDKSIATVNKNGKVRGIKAGTCTITAKRNGARATCKIKVLPNYGKYNRIPDFGATVGKVRSAFRIEGNIRVAEYTAKDVAQAKKWVNAYRQKIKKKGFEFDNYFSFWKLGDYDDGVGVKITRNEKLITIKYGFASALVEDAIVDEWE